MENEKEKDNKVEVDNQIEEKPVEKPTDTLELDIKINEVINQLKKYVDLKISNLKSDLPKEETKKERTF